MSIERTLERIADALEKSAELLEKMANPQITINTMEARTINAGSPIADVAAAVFGDPTPAVAPPAKKAGRPAGPKNAPVEPATEAKAVTRDDVMDSMRELVRKMGPEKGPIAGKELLGKFGAGRISELDEQHFAAAYAELQKALK